MNNVFKQVKLSNADSRKKESGNYRICHFLPIAQGVLSYISVFLKRVFEKKVFYVDNEYLRCFDTRIESLLISMRKT